MSVVPAAFLLVLVLVSLLVADTVIVRCTVHSTNFKIHVFDAIFPPTAASTIVGTPLRCNTARDASKEEEERWDEQFHGVAFVEKVARLGTQNGGQISNL